MLIRILILLSFQIILVGPITAQAPLQFNYQAVARDSKGIPLVDKDIKVRFSIHNNFSEGAVEYMEIRKVRTNPFGMFNVSIGSSDAYFSSGSLADVDWGNGKKFLTVEIDFEGLNNYINMGSTQMVSVPYAMFALKTLNPGNTKISLVSRNGLSLEDTLIQLGNKIGDTSAAFTEDRFLHLNSNSLVLKDNVDEISFSKGKITIQQDSALAPGESSNSGGPFFVINPIFNRPDALPFVFSRMATQQHNGLVSPNEVVIWGNNLSAGGSNIISNLPAIGYSIESNYRPSPDYRFVESHEFYVSPSGKQFRLKSYTINTNTDFIDFYHTVNKFYLKNPNGAADYFNITTSDDNTTQQMNIGNLKFIIDNTLNQFQIQSNQSNSQLYFNGNWEYIFLPGLAIEVKEKLYHFDANIIPTEDSKRILGAEGSRYQGIYSKGYFGEGLSLKQGWQLNETLTPTAALDIEGINGFNQLRLRKSYTPTSSSDVNGNIGDLSWDENFIYIKTESGWKRTSLSSF